MLSFQDNHTYADPEKNETSLKKISQLMFIKECYQSWDQFFLHNIHVFKDQHFGHTCVDKYVKLQLL